MSNNWRTDTLSMVELIQRDIENGTKYYRMVKADIAENYPILKDGIRWEPSNQMIKLREFGIIDEETLTTLAIEKPCDEVKSLARQLGWTLAEYQTIFHSTEEEETDE